MAEYRAAVRWQRDGAAFVDHRYSRAHRWQFDGGIEVPASSSPQVVPLPMSLEAAVDPEEAFVAALASCHLLWFLWLAARAGFVVDTYDDQAAGTLARNGQGRLAMTEVVLRPRVSFAGDRRPTAAEHEALHHRAHDECFIASSVRTAVRFEPALV